jgi:hypothetical protein
MRQMNPSFEGHLGFPFSFHTAKLDSVLENHLNNTTVAKKHQKPYRTN